jgi:hypothetical protein
VCFIACGSPLAAVDLALGQFGLRAQAGQRRLQLVRGVGQEVALRAADGLVQPLQQVVDGAHQRRHLLGHVALGDRAQVGALAAADALLQFGQRRMPRASASHTSSTASGRITNCGRITPLMISVASRERLPSVSATCTSARAAAPAGGRQPQVGHAHRLVAHRVVAKAQPRRRAGASGGTGRSASPASNSPRWPSTWK